MELRLLILADLHYAATADDAAGPARRRCLLGRELLRRAIEDARRHGGFNAIALMGDLINRGETSPRAEQSLGELAGDLASLAPSVPVLVVPGNHDGDAQRLLEIFHHPAGARRIGEYRFFVFRDPYGPDDVCTRTEDDLRRFREFASQSHGPIVVLQHNPIHPVIDEPYPYMPTNRPRIMQDYASAGAVLSVSGHYHKGTPPRTADGVTYLTAPALCEAPFAYTLAHLRGHEVELTPHRLVLECEAPLFDSHAHTEFAYCGSGISAEAEIDRAHTFALGGLFLVEHSPQLYVTKEAFYSGQHVRQPELWQSGLHDRAEAFRQTMLPRRDGFVRIGLEVELDAEDRMILADKDRGWQDILVGAVHFLNKDHLEYSDAEMATEFMRVTRKLVDYRVHVLAHPWRVFTWFKRTVPAHLYKELADLLAERGVAAEVNCHLNSNDPAFFETCIDRGVKLALGSDAHLPHEMGDLHEHLAFLRQIAAGKPLGELLAF